MKFKCGPTREELERKLEAQEKKRVAKLNHLRNWHPFFALLPKEVAPGECRWLEFIERRCPSARYLFFGIIEKENHDWLDPDARPIEYRAIKK